MIQGSLVQRILDRDSEMHQKKSNFDTVWQEISEYVVPNRGDFITKRSQAERIDRRVFDSTAVHANEMLASALHTGLTNPSSKWFDMQPVDTDIQDDDEVKGYVANAVKKMYNVLNSPTTGFYQHNHEFLMEITSYGTSIMFIDESLESTVRFKNVHLSQCSIEENNQGEVDTVHRRFKMTPRQAVQQFGEENEDLQKKLRAYPNEELEFTHVVMPIKDYERMGGTNAPTGGQKFASVYVCKDCKDPLEEGGYFEMPYVVARWTKVVGEIYGRSPAWNALSDIRMINVMSETIVRAAQKQVDPPMLMADDGVIMPLHTYPSGVNIGGLSDDGKPLIQALQTGGDLGLGDAMLQQRREAIQKAFFVDQFAPSQGTPASATERSQLEQTALRLTGPHLNRLQVEYANRLLDRLFGILQRSGKLGKAPQSLQGRELKIEYISPLANNQRAPELQAILTAIGSVGPLIEMNPDLLDHVDADNLFRENLAIAGVPREHIMSLAAVAEMRQQKQAQLQQQQALQQGQELANTAATLQKSGIPIT